MKHFLKQAAAVAVLIALTVTTLLPTSALAEVRTNHILSRVEKSISDTHGKAAAGFGTTAHAPKRSEQGEFWDGSISLGFAGGSGTESDPYLISNGAELAYLAQQVNSGTSYSDIYFKLTNDIWLNDANDWALWGTTGSFSANALNTLDKGFERDMPIDVQASSADDPESEGYTLSDALNASGQSNTFVSTGSYPWQVDLTTYEGRIVAKSGNYNVDDSTSSFSTTVTLSAGDIVSFDYCVSCESTYDRFLFAVNDSVVLVESGLVSWNSYSYQATADGEYTFTWEYIKDLVFSGNSDTCWVDNVYIGMPLSATGIEVAERLDIPRNSTGTVVYNVLPENVYNKNVSFESADTSIATVDANGVVTGVSVGETVITVTTEDGGFTGTCTVNVFNRAVAGVTLEPAEAEIVAGSSTRLSATVFPKDASNKNVIYSVDNENILSVEQNGKVTGLSAGTATVTVTTEDGGFTASAEITVLSGAVTGVSISPKSAVVGAGDTVRFTAEIQPSNAANKNLSWSVSDEAIASVDGQGNVTGLSQGTATVTVTTADGGFTASAEITVLNEWTPIGTDSDSFNGIFDGDGYAVHGMYINNPESDYQGLFGNTSDAAVITNLGTEKSYIYGKSNVGGVAGAGGDVINCYNTGIVISKSYCVGGVVGRAYSEVINCHNTGTVSCAKETEVGGVVGRANSDVVNCYNTGSVNGNYAVGGVVGFARSGNIAYNCYNTGSVSGNGDIGGVVGYGGTVNCYNTGSVNGTGNRVGGVAGCASSDAVNCYNTGSVSGAGDRVGGVAGDKESSVTVSNCYYYVACCAEGDEYGTALTLAQMTNAESFAGFDFETVWTMGGNPEYTYPEIAGNIHVGNPNTNPELGDINGDGEITTMDALIILRSAIGISDAALTAEQLAAADFNGDGVVDAVDAILLMRAAIGIS